MRNVFRLGIADHAFITENRVLTFIHKSVFYFLFPPSLCLGGGVRVVYLESLCVLAVLYDNDLISADQGTRTA